MCDRLANVHFKSITMIGIAFSYVSFNVLMNCEFYTHEEIDYLLIKHDAIQPKRDEKEKRPMRTHFEWMFQKRANLHLRRVFLC